MLKLADIFNAPSDDEDFLGFGADVPMETLSLEDSYESFDSLDSRKMDFHFQPNSLTEKLRKIFTEDTDSENEAFEGFSSNEREVNSEEDVEAVELDLESDPLSLMVAEEDDRGKESPKRRNLGFRVALQFPTKKSEKTSKFCLTGSKHPHSLTQTKTNQTWGKKDPETSSKSGEEAKEVPDESSSALLKRAMNIKENKAMLAQLLAELNSIPDLFPVKTTSTPKQKKTPRKTFSEGQIERRTNPTRNARPPEKFALENFTASAVRFAEQLNSYRRQNLLKKRLKGGNVEVRKRRRSSKYCSFRSVEDITDEDLENVAITVKDKIYDKVLGSTCHQCRQKTIDTKTVCRNEGCGGMRGQFCGPCLRNRYGEDVKSALLDPDWFCPPCRGICNCSYCRKRDGRCATGMLIHLAKFYGYDNVKEYLESLQKQLAEDD
ncbi:Cell division cycle-associated 7-like protein [Varanus komodoensis]|uniref:cell division cycle-associated 7-like protein isoform X1 n=1 Tax=Varanus komodoensis TaxID=61221 RepID=UPI001CF7E4CA|nr:cell division cycle-associated 7-like protein isoform X1 [Varanus komodoensis]XP_044285268.1 cell division cycle-associated 7-like protein isoform X1 [Varanus komodoensis]KAF7252431.1 Cell division cycle-associated 7-like protein [Varanus komodoensis]